MNKETLEIDSLVKATYKTGQYIGKVTAILPSHYTVRIASVLKHPTQGDLHNMKQVDVPLFHQRRALAYREQANVPSTAVKPYDGKVLDYQSSLRTALNKEKDKLSTEDTAWAKASLELLEDLEKSYFK